MGTARKIFVFTVVFFSVLFTAAIILARIFEDELTQYVVDGLNKQVRTEIKVEDVKLSFIKRFPDASLEFKDVFIASVPDFQAAVFSDDNTDTLLCAEQLFLRFNLTRLLKREYLVREVQVRSGKLYVFIDRAGNGNYRFWEKKEDPGQASFQLELDNFNLSDIQLKFINKALDVDVDAELLKSLFKGQFSREIYSMSAQLDGKINNYYNQGVLILSEQKLRINSSLSIDPQAIRIDEGNLVLSGQHVLVSGEILRPKPLDLDLRFQGKSLDLQTILQHLSVSSVDIPEDIRAGGNIDFSGQIKGVASNTRMPWIEANFSLDGGWLSSGLYPMRIEEIRTHGKYSNGIRQGPVSTLIQLNDVSMRIGNSRIGGDYSVFNLVSPDFNYQIKLDLDLSDIQEFIKSDSIVDYLKGSLLAEIGIKGNQPLLENLGSADLLNYNYNASMLFEGVSIKPSKLPFAFNDFSAEAVFTDYLQVSNLNGVFEDSYISMSGRVDNFLEFLFTQEGNLWMDIDVYSERLNLNHLRSFNARSDKINKADSIFLPERIYLKTRFWLDELEIKDFSAEQIMGDLIYKPKRLSINNIELQTAGGRVVAEGLLEQQEDMHFLVKSISDVESVDISQVFSSFNNFGQDFIADRHLNGTLSGIVNFSAGLNEKMKIKKESLLADCDVIIRDGELIGFEPMTNLSKYIDVEELEHIRFSTLENEIFIRNSEVVIPKMEISSSVSDITASGLHGFDKNFTYKFKVSLSELRSKKSKRLSRQESEFGVIEDDGLGKVYIYLIVEGTPDGTDVKFDRKGAVQNVREQMREEKKELRQILNEEFGLFKKDSSLFDEGKQEKPPEFQIEWDEVARQKANDDRTGNKKEGEKFIIVWDEEEEDPDTLEDKSRRKKKKKKKR